MQKQIEGSRAVAEAVALTIEPAVHIIKAEMAHLGDTQVRIMVGEVEVGATAEVLLPVA